MSEHIFRWLVVTLLFAILFCLVILVEHTPTPILVKDLYSAEGKALPIEQKRILRKRIPLVQVEGDVTVEPVEILR